jgi:FOG: CheY-like receiver
MLRVLAVDDEPAFLELTRAYLERDGDIEVETTSSPLQALDMLTETPYDAIVADYEMPEMNGIALLQEVRRRGLSIPFIIFSGRGREEAIIEALNSGADFYLQKGGTLPPGLPNSTTSSCRRPGDGVPRWRRSVPATSTGASLSTPALPPS